MFFQGPERERVAYWTHPQVGWTPNASPLCLLGLAIGCCFTLPPENPDTNGVRFRSEQLATCLGLFDGVASGP